MARWSETVWAVWGKTRRDDDTWLPLVTHLEAAADVAALLWDHWLPPTVKAHIGDVLPRGEQDGRTLVSWLAGVHDVGKASPPFVMKAPLIADRLIRLGLPVDVSHQEARQAPHGLVGYIALIDWLEQRRPGSRGNALSYAVAVGAHHGVMAGSADVQQVRNSPQLLGGPAWQVVREEILTGIADRTGATDRLGSWMSRPLPATVQVLVASVVVIADWLASDEGRFPGDADSEPVSPTWTRLDLPSPWRPGAPLRSAEQVLAERFPTLRGAPPTSVQQAAVAAAWAADRACLIVLEAEMGSGKTEAGLGAAEILAHRFGCGGVFVALPTMATSDAMFARVRDWVEHLPGDIDVAMHLAHGKARLNQDFAGLTPHLKMSAVYDDDIVENASDRNGGVDPAHISHAVATVHSWLRGRRKGVLASMVVGTIDQVLFGALRSRHLALRHLALAGKVVVIDEVHASDAYMRHYLSAMLTWLGAYGTPVVLMSATLPQAQRRQLIDAYTAGAARGGTDQPRPSKTLTVPEGGHYPRALLVDSQAIDIPAEQTSSRPRIVQVDELDDSTETLTDRLAGLLEQGGCAAVIRNTVSRAQEAYAVLRRHFGHDVVMIHSRFIATNRARREDHLRRLLGRSSSLTDGSRPRRLIVVGTQVLEQSLDVDFDVMISDLAPVDLLLQRLGRLHRHQRGEHEADRPAPLRSPRLLLTGADWDQVPVRAVLGSRLVYGQSALLRSAAVLRSTHGTIHLPEDIPTLVQTAFDPDALAPAGWEQAWTSADDAEERRVDEAIDRAGAFRLPGRLPRTGQTLAEIGFFDSSDPENGSGGRHQVRDSEDSLEVIVVRRQAGRIMAWPGCGLDTDTVIATDWPPEDRIAKVLAGCTLRLPSWATARTIDDVIDELERAAFPGWQGSRWLTGELVLMFDESGAAEVAGMRLSYDDEVGLTVTMKEDT